MYIRLLIISAVITATYIVFVSPNANYKIIGGEDTDIESNPWVVSLHDEEGYLCGGSLIDSSWVLTSSRCIEESNGNITIRSGSNNRSSGGEEIAVSNVIVHENWGSSFMDFDIALLELLTPISDPIPRSVELPSALEPIPENSFVTIAGWGLTSWESYTLPYILRKVEVAVISNENCRKAYDDDMITDNMFCAGDMQEGKKDWCDGDAGGPAVINGVQFGIISWGIGCGDKANPGIYTSIPVFREWIKEHSGV